MLAVIQEPTELHVLCYFWFLLNFPHEGLNVTDTSCTLWVSSCNITLPSAHIGTLVWVFPREKPKMAGSRVRPDHVSKYIPADLCSFFSQFKCCGWNNYTDWSWNLYFNCTHENPSSERCAVPYSCCTPVPGEVCALFGPSAAKLIKMLIG